MSRIHIILLTLVAICCQSCTFRPAIDAEGIISVRKPNPFMHSHGKREFERLKRTKAMTQSPQFTRPLERVASRLKKVIVMPNADWEFVVFRDRSPNAFALPGGKVGVNTGLFHLIGNHDHSEALLAAVLGHEISHATTNHADHRMYRGIGLILISSLLWQSLDHNDVDQPALGVVAFVTASHLADSLPFSRKQEYEADKIGAIYMAKAGYDPRFAIELWRKMRAYHIRQGKRKPEFLRTHPDDDHRIVALEQFMPVALRYYKPNADSADYAK